MIHFFLNRYWIVRLVAQSEMEGDGEEEVDDAYPSQDRSRNIHEFYSQKFSPPSPSSRQAKEKKKKKKIYIDSSTDDEEPSPGKKVKHIK